MQTRRTFPRSGTRRSLCVLSRPGRWLGRPCRPGGSGDFLSLSSGLLFDAFYPQNNLQVMCKEKIVAKGLGPHDTGTDMKPALTPVVGAQMVFDSSDLVGDGL